MGFVFNIVWGCKGWVWVVGDEMIKDCVSEYVVFGWVIDFSGLFEVYLDVGFVEVFREEVVVYVRKFW